VNKRKKERTTEKNVTQKEKRIRGPRRGRDVVSGENHLNGNVSSTQAFFTGTVAHYYSFTIPAIFREWKRQYVLIHNCRNVFIGFPVLFPTKELLFELI